MRWVIFHLPSSLALCSTATGGDENICSSREIERRKQTRVGREGKKILNSEKKPSTCAVKGRSFHIHDECLMVQSRYNSQYLFKRSTPQHGKSAEEILQKFWARKTDRTRHKHGPRVDNYMENLPHPTRATLLVVYPSSSTSDDSIACNHMRNLCVCKSDWQHEKGPGEFMVIIAWSWVQSDQSYGHQQLNCDPTKKFRLIGMFDVCLQRVLIWKFVRLLVLRARTRLLPRAIV